MNTECAAIVEEEPCAYELRFDSLFNPGRSVVVPCDVIGKVDLDALSERLRLTYLWARALIGREFAYPKVQPARR